MMMMMMYL